MKHDERHEPLPEGAMSEWQMDHVRVRCPACGGWSLHELPERHPTVVYTCEACDAEVQVDLEVRIQARVKACWVLG